MAVARLTHIVVSLMINPKVQKEDRWDAVLNEGSHIARELECLRGLKCQGHAIRQCRNWRLARNGGRGAFAAIIQKAPRHQYCNVGVVLPGAPLLR
jgi:hypothetical protein